MYAPNSEVSAVATDRLRQGALGRGEKAGRNVARDAYRMIRRCGTYWKIPVESFDYQKIDGTFLTTHYLCPQKILQYFIANRPVLICGAQNASDMKQNCGAFWEAYKGFHSSHLVFQTHSENLHRVVPLALWGDDGKGKRRSNTTLVALEAVIGCKGETSGCRTCSPCCLDLSQYGPRGDDHFLLAKRLRTNMKSHSYLQHWPLFIVPSTLNKNYKPLTFQLMDLVATSLEELFTVGVQVAGETWFGAVVGAKGDLKWHAKIGKLVRCHEHQGRVVDRPCAIIV
eukprot:Skav214160  [mRNA]  locus=scaffold945:141312:142163:+ [translate_table: standard]